MTNTTNVNKYLYAWTDEKWNEMRREREEGIGIKQDMKNEKIDHNAAE